jgi:hypothetical protein
LVQKGPAGKRLRRFKSGETAGSRQRGASRHSRDGLPENISATLIGQRVTESYRSDVKGSNS